MSRRVMLLLLSDKSWLYEPHKNRTCGPFRNVRADCARNHAGKQTDAMVVFPFAAKYSPRDCEFVLPRAPVDVRTMHQLPNRTDTPRGRVLATPPQRNR